MAATMSRMSSTVEMSAKGRPRSIFAQPMRPLSQTTEISDSDWEDSKSDSGSEFEEDSPRESFDTNTSYDEAPTPQSTHKAIFDVQIRRSTTSITGPRGPHLFRTSFDSYSEAALQMSPIHAKAPAITVDEVVNSPTPVNSASLPFSRHTSQPAEQEQEAEEDDHKDVEQWTTEEVALWMHHAGFEEEVIQKFEDHDVNGAVLIDLQFEDLKEFGIPSFGKRHQIWTELGKLRDDGHSSPAPTAIESRPATATPSRSNSKAKDRVPGKTVTPTTSRRRRVARVRNCFDEAVTPAESVSIVAIEQLLPKPHKCSKGETCPKWQKQQRMKEQLGREHGFSISPARGGHIFIAGNPGAVFQSNDSNIDSKTTTLATRPMSDTQPSVVASSDLLGPGLVPNIALDEESLQNLQQRDPQEHVKHFLNFQHVQTSPETPPSPPLETPRFNVSHMPDTPNLDTSIPPQTPALPTPLPTLQQLPKLSIPRSASTNPGTLRSPGQTGAPSASKIPRLDTPASEMDVPLTGNVILTPVSRDNSQSVPPNMKYRQQTKHRPGSQDPSTWQRASMKLPTLPEDGGPAPVKSSNLLTPTREPIKVGPKALYGSGTTHAGYMKKRKTKFLRHEWNDQHFRLSGTKLAMHASAKQDDKKALETINVDEYSVACSSLASNSKLSAALKNLKITSGKKELSFEEAAFAFQLIPATERAKALSLLKDGKTHYFAVKSRDDRIDWMREIMLAKAAKHKQDGFEVTVNGETL